MDYIVKYAAQLGKMAITTFSARNLEDVNPSGHPRNVILAGRDQTKDFGLSGVKGAVKSALLTGIDAANPIAATVCNAIASAYKLASDLYFRYEGRLRFAFLIKDAKRGLRKKFLDDPDGFNKRLLKTVKDLPVLSSY